MKYFIKDRQSLSDSRILITGASGWIGRETLCYLQESFGSVSDIKLTLVGSASRFLEIHGEQVHITKITDIEPEGNFDLILHYAFATQDKALSLGFDEYKEKNIELNRIAQNLSEQNPNAKNLILSSGVASLPHQSHRSESMRLYAELKHDLENRFQNNNSLVLRLWNTSGHHLGNNPNYAISEFISKAKNNQDIEIRNNVRRSYISAQDLIGASLGYLLSGGYGIVNSGGVETDLLNLSKQVIEVNKSNSKVVTTGIQSDLTLDYVSPPTEIPQTFWKSNKSLVEQIVLTSSEIN